MVHVFQFIRCGWLSTQHYCGQSSMQMEEMEATSLLFYQLGGMSITGIVGLLVSNREKIHGRRGELTSVTLGDCCRYLVV